MLFRDSLAVQNAPGWRRFIEKFVIDLPTMLFLLGLHSKLRQYGGWIKHIQYRHYLSTVQCVIRLCNSS